MGEQHKNCVTIWSLGGINISLSRDLLKTFGLCKYFGFPKMPLIQLILKKSFMCLIWLSLRSKTFGVSSKKSLQTNPPDILELQSK